MLYKPKSELLKCSQNLNLNCCKFGGQEIWPKFGLERNPDTVESGFINIMKTAFLFMCLLLTSFFRITSLHVNQEKLF